MSVAHDHGGRAEQRGAQRRALWFSLGANAVFLVAELAGGIVFRSLALLADGVHMVSDVAGLAVALVAQRLLDRPSTTRHSYGLQRAEVLGAQLNGFVLVTVSIWVVYEAVQRLRSPADVAGAGLLAIATGGLVVNVVSAVLLARVQGRSLNVRGAFLHMASDAAGSVGAIVAGVAVLVWGAAWVDPAVSLLIAGLVLWSAWGLLRETTHVLLEGTPENMDPDTIRRALRADPDVEAVHHLHLWNLASDTPALSAHVVLGEDVSLHDAQERGERLKAMLHDQFGVEHATLELECHPCDEPGETAAHPERGPTAR